MKFPKDIFVEEIFQAFGIKPRGLHNALEDCRIAAEVLRKVVGEWVLI
jgi:DNA polymerase III epsilon subunit-like protein